MHLGMWMGSRHIALKVIVLQNFEVCRLVGESIDRTQCNYPSTLKTGKYY